MAPKRRIHDLAREQAAELLGPDLPPHQRRIRSAEGIRFAFSELQVPGFRDVASIQEVVTEDALVSPQIADLDN